MQAYILFIGVYLFKRLFVGFWVSRQASPFGAGQFSDFLQALRCLRGTMFFRGLRPSLIQQFLFWLLGLTVQSSRPAFGGRLTFFR